MARSRNFCFTLNNYLETDEDILKNLQISGRAKYLLYGKETAPSTGTKHLQGFVVFPSLKNLPAVVAELPRGAHVEVCRGNVQDNVKYCKKGGDFVEMGAAPADKRKETMEEWALAKKQAEEGKFDDIRPDFYCRYLHNWEMIRQRKLQKQKLEWLPAVCGEWWWGVSGAGKSWKARAENPGAFIHTRTHWWNGYDGQDVVIMDEMTPDFARMMRCHLCEWADIYPFNAEIKNSMQFIRPKKVIVISNFSPEECFPLAKDLEAIRRRYKVTHFSQVYRAGAVALTQVIAPDDIDNEPVARPVSPIARHQHDDFYNFDSEDAQPPNS